MPRTAILVVAAILLVFLSSLSTYAVLTFMPRGEGGIGESNSRRFDVFEGYKRCDAAVRNAVAGKVISIEGDDRAAHYNRTSNLNMLFFAVDYSQEGGMFGYSGGKLKRTYARCEVSAETNRIEAVRLRPADEKEYTEVIRRPK